MNTTRVFLYNFRIHISFSFQIWNFSIQCPLWMITSPVFAHFLCVSQQISILMFKILAMARQLRANRNFQKSRLVGCTNNYPTLLTHCFCVNSRLCWRDCRLNFSDSPLVCCKLVLQRHKVVMILRNETSTIWEKFNQTGRWKYYQIK